MRVRGALGLLMGAMFVLPASANASTIVYDCGTNLCRVSPDGTGQQQLTNDGSSSNPYEGASMDPAGDRMVFIHGFDLYASDANAQNAVGPLDTYGSAPAKISFDGSKAVDRRFYPSLNAYYICTFDTTAGSAADCRGLGRFPAFTPDGQLVASQLYNGHDAVCLIDFQSRNCTRDIAVDPNADLDEAAVSPDGQTLAVVAISSGTTGSIELFSMSSGQREKVLTNGPDEAPAWSPDGSKIVFSRNGDLYTIPVSGGSGSEQLLLHGGDTPTWGGPAGGGGSGATGGTGGTGGSLGGPPNTSLGKVTINRKARSATFKFGDSGQASGFQCALVRQPKKRKGHNHSKPSFSSCRSPKTYKNMSRGKYTFYVRALGRGGADPTPATKSFSI